MHTNITENCLKIALAPYNFLSPSPFPFPSLSPSSFSPSPLRPSLSLRYLSITLALLVQLAAGDLAYDYSALVSYYSTIPSSSPTTSCYEWYFDVHTDGDSAKAPYVVGAASEVIARVWVMSATGNANPGELAGNAAGPSQPSVQATRLFANLGERPVISFFEQPGMPSSLAPDFNATGAFWIYNFTTPSAGGLIPVSIAGRDVNILGCDVPQRRFLFPHLSPLQSRVSPSFSHY